MCAPADHPEAFHGHSSALILRKGLEFDLSLGDNLLASADSRLNPSLTTRFT
jgi:hypothetical protein